MTPSSTLQRFSGPIPHFVAGGRTELGNRSLPLYSPRTGVQYGELSLAGPTAVDQAVISAQHAFRSWRSTPVKERIQPLLRFQLLLQDHAEELAALASRESGKTEAEALAGLHRGMEVVELALAAPVLLAGEYLEVSRGIDCHSRRRPLGVVAGITPFNFPAMVPLWMFPLAIAAGNCFLLKPSEKVPCTSVRMAELMQDAGLPEGVFQVIHGDREASRAILEHPEIRAVAFVGSTPAAQEVYLHGIQAGKRMLCLGGAKNHVVILPDAAPELTAHNLTGSVTGCAGQRCMAASVALAVGPCEPVLERVVDAMAGVRPGVDMGALISREAVARVSGYVDRAEQDGAVIALDGRSPAVPEHPNGFYFGPTVVDRIEPGAPAAREEIFGPVLSVIRVDTLDEALSLENESPYGNAAAIYTQNPAAARHFEEHASAGMIGINVGVPVPRDPFSFGGWNHSRFGMGDITGPDAFHFWTQSQKTTVRWS